MLSYIIQARKQLGVCLNSIYIYQKSIRKESLTYTLLVKLKGTAMTLKEFYYLIYKEFGNGIPLEYKWTKKDGYWTMTKGFINGTNKSMSVHDLDQFIKEEKAMKKGKKKEPKKKDKKPYTKYSGDLI
tara:strand:+ start:180 stop:563 length:384 start_codon:yes stop_codon:yes gene_type:complete